MILPKQSRNTPTGVGKLPVDCTRNECPDVSHTPTMAEKIENDDPAWGDDWHEKHQVAERREVMLEGMV